MAENLLLLIIFLPLLGALFVGASRDENTVMSQNAPSVAIWTICTNIFLILKLFSIIDTSSDNLQAGSQINWQVMPPVELAIGIDVFSLLLILAMQIVLLLGIFSIKDELKHRKPSILFSLLFLSCINGYFAAADLFSFYMFFVLMIFPLFMQMGISCGEKNKKIISRFFLYNFLGALILLSAVIIIYSHQNTFTAISKMSEVKISADYALLVWSGIFISFILRLPVWPFHYWISSVNTTLKNPLAFLSVNLLPVSGLYGFIRFWPSVIPDEISSLVPIFETFCILTMLYLAFSGYSATNLRDKLFSYIFIYYLLYLLGVFSPTDILQRNIGYSLFAFLLVAAGMVMLVAHIERQSEKLHQTSAGILCLQPKAALAYAALILAAVGFPVSALFWNNFIIISEILKVNTYIGHFAVLSIALAAVFLLQNLYMLKDKSCLLPGDEKIDDISNLQFGAAVTVVIVLLLSFIKPLWFVL